MKQTGRLESIDFVRGAAIVVMAAYHFMRTFINESTMNPILHQMIAIPGRLAAPFFLLISGVSLVLLFYNSELKGIKQKEIISTTVKRGLFLIALSTFMNILSTYTFASGDIWEWNIFQILGVALILSVGLVKMRLLGTIIFVLLYQYVWFMLRKIGWECDILMNGIFPIIPWLNYILFGMLTGHFIFWWINNPGWIRFKWQGAGLLFLLTLFLWYKFFNYSTVLAVEKRPFFNSMVLIYFAFCTVLCIAQFLIPIIKTCLANIIDLGQIALSVYYIHMVYQYSLKVVIKFIETTPKENWHLLEWLLLNLFFFVPLFIGINLWKKVNYSFGAEWFMNRYISARSIVKE